MSRSVQSYLLWSMISLLLGLVFTIAIWYVDFEIVSPLILPEDFCYYHTHETPVWVDFFYMNGASNGHPEGSLFHFGLVIVFGFISGFLISRFIRLLITRKSKNYE